MNKITLIGNLTKKPEAYENNGKTAVNFTLAVSRRFDKDTTDFFSVWVHGKQADSCMKYLDKGKKAAVVGEFQFKEYEKKDGTKAHSLNVTADDVEFLSPRTEVKADDFEDINSPDLPWN